MKGNLIKNLGLIFTLFLVLAIWLTWQSRNFGQENDLSEVSANLNNFNYESVKKFTFNHDEEEKVFELKEGAWYINGEVADDVKIEAFWNKFEEFSLVRLVTKDEKKHSIFELDQEKSSRLTFYSEEGDSVFYLGKNDGPTKFFIRKKGVANVYLASSMIKSDLTQPADYFKKEIGKNSKE